MNTKYISFFFLSAIKFDFQAQNLGTFSMQNIYRRHDTYRNTKQYLMEPRDISEKTHYLAYRTYIKNHVCDMFAEEMFS